MSDDSDDGDPLGAISEDLVTSPTHKTAATTRVDFDGLLQTPLVLQEDLSQGCGGQLWPAGMVLAKYLLRSLGMKPLHGKTILELGSGGGLVGLALALALGLNPCGSTGSTACGTSITITDQIPMLSLMQRNIALNNLPTVQVKASVLDWGASELAFEQPDILLAADCVYFEPAFPLLLQTMSHLIGSHSVCYFCFKKRRRADLRFLKDMKKLFTTEEILDDPDRQRWSMEGLFL